MIFLVAGTVAVLLAAAVTDVRKKKIPNILLIGLIVFWTLSNLISQMLFGEQLFEGKSVLIRIGISLVILVFLYPFFAIGKLGAGDVKLIALTAFSVENQLIYLLSVFVIGASIGVIQIIKQKIKKENKPIMVKLGVAVLGAYCLLTVPGLF